MKHITVYGFNGSTYVSTVELVAKYKGIQSTLEGFEFCSPEHAKLHPFLKMPAAKIDGKPLYESLAICIALDEAEQKNSLQPIDPFEKAKMFQWISSTIDYIYPRLVSTPLSEEELSAENLNEVTKILILLDKELEDQQKKYLVSDQVCIADFYIYPILKFASVKIDNFKSLIKELNHLDRWYQTMNQF